MSSNAGLLEMTLKGVKRGKIPPSEASKIFQNMNIKKGDLLLVLKALESGYITVSEAKEEIQERGIKICH